MNTEIFKGSLTELVGIVKRDLGKLTDDDKLRFEGNLEVMVGHVQKTYGVTREQAEQAVKDSQL